MSALLARHPGASRLLPILAIVVAAMLRAAALGVGSGNLADDRDDYLVVARHYADEGFWTPFVGIPNSFRPPLYPLVIAAILKAGGGSVALGLLQLALGTATVALTWHLGQRLGLGLMSTVAAALVALDPLLIEYTTFPMTETLFTFLVALLVTVATPNRSKAVERWQTTLRAAGIGAVFGACALCRPTIWPVAGLAAAWLLWRSRRTHGRIRDLLWTGAVAVLAAAAVVSPWMLRNWKILGSPILTTTHGGYTLLLGNNEAFFHQVAARPLLEEWRDSRPDRFQRPWFRDLVADMDRELGPGAGEIPQDRWMYRRAAHAIAAQPRLFLRACLLRFAEFWNVVPLPPSRLGGFHGRRLGPVRRLFDRAGLIRGSARHPVSSMGRSLDAPLAPDSQLHRGALVLLVEHADARPACPLDRACRNPWNRGTLPSRESSPPKSFGSRHFRAPLKPTVLDVNQKTNSGKRDLKDSQ